MEQTKIANPVQTGRRVPIQLEMDALLSYILLYGVMLSLGLVVVGLFWRWAETGHLNFDYELVGMNLFQFATTQIRMTIRGEVRPRLLMNLGIAVLMLTPYMRVAASLIFFMTVAKNWKYSLFTGFVLAVLSYTLFMR